jgi:hypothetical protein
VALTPFDLAGYFVDDAKELVVARERAIKVHRNRDIDAAGDEIEIPIREVLRARLSRKYYVGHGHIVDSRLMTSRQLDVIIADDANTPVLFKAKNGTAFVPYESVYAIGEAKSTYYRSAKPIEAFSRVLREINKGLSRQQIIFSMGSNGVTNVVRQNPLGLNPLFPFMLFVDGEEFRFADVRDYYYGTPLEELPSVVCILNKGVILRASIVYSNGRHSMRGIIINPTIVGTPPVPEEHRWIFLKATDPDEEKNLGFCLAMLSFMLFGSLSISAVLPPDMPTYLNQVLASYPAQIE